MIIVILMVYCLVQAVWRSPQTLNSKSLPFEFAIFLKVSSAVPKKFKASFQNLVGSFIKPY